MVRRFSQGDEAMPVDKRSHPEKIEHRVRELLAEWEYHRGSLPEPLINALTKLRDAVRAADLDPQTPRAETPRQA
jgi:hypothetical protein